MQSKVKISETLKAHISGTETDINKREKAFFSVLTTLYNVCSVHRGDIMSTSGGYHEYIGGCSVHRGIHEYIGGIPLVHRGDIMSTSGGYHECIRGCSVHRRDIMIHVGEQLDKILSISIENSDVLNIPRCTHGIPPNVSLYPPDVMNIPRCTHDIPPDVLMVSLRCTEHPPMYSWYPPDVLNTHYTGC